MKRKDIQEGEWYFNPMMEASGVTKLRYAKVFSVDREKFPSCNVILYSEGVTSNGNYMHFDPSKPDLMVRQSNERYETDMRRVEEREVKLYVASKKYGL